MNKNEKEKKDNKKVVEEEVLEKKESFQEEKLKIKISDVILVVALVLVVVLGCFIMKGKKVEPSYELPLTLSGDVGLQQLTYAEYKEKVDNDESFVLIIERATCSHCITYMPVAESFAKDNQVPMYYVDTDTFTEEDWNGFETSNTFLKKKAGDWGTPTTVVLAGKESVDYIEGSTNADNLLDLYNKYFEME